MALSTASRLGPYEIQSLIGVMVYKEPFTRTQFTGYSMVWVGLNGTACPLLWVSPRVIWTDRSRRTGQPRLSVGTRIVGRRTVH